MYLWSSIRTEGPVSMILKVCIQFQDRFSTVDLDISDRFQFPIHMRLCWILEPAPFTILKEIRFISLISVGHWADLFIVHRAVEKKIWNSFLTMWPPWAAIELFVEICRNGKAQDKTWGVISVHWGPLKASYESVWQKGLDNAGLASSFHPRGF